MDNYINATGLVGIRVIDRHCRIVCRFHSEIKISIKSPVVIGPVHIETTQSHFIPPVAGAIALVVGVILLVGGSKKV